MSDYSENTLVEQPAIALFAESSPAIEGLLSSAGYTIRPAGMSYHVRSYPK